MSMNTLARVSSLIVTATLSMSGAASAQSRSENANDRARLLLDTRIRYEGVDQSRMAEEAAASTVRVRAGVETTEAWKTSFTVEGEIVQRLSGSYRSDNAVATQTGYPVIADPDSQEINRLQLVNKAVRDTVVTLGRQRIVLDDQRFVGNVGWRQNEQTFDAVRIVNRTWPSLTVDLTYLDQVNRVFGPDSPQGRYHGDGYLANVSYQWPLGKLTAFGYAFAFESISNIPATLDPSRVSTETYGARFAGERAAGVVKIGYVLAYARQQDYRNNPLTFDLDNSLLELSATWHAFNAGVGWEVLEGNGRTGFSAPLGTLHRFQGWADKFMTTPGEGIDDRYVNAGAQLKNLWGADVVSALVVYHDFRGERAAIDLGSELDLQMQARWRQFTGTLKYASYSNSASTPAAYQDTRKLWLMLEHSL